MHVKESSAAAIGLAMRSHGYPTLRVDKSQRYKLLPAYVYEGKSSATTTTPKS